MPPRRESSFLRPLAVIAMLILAAYWVGARWGAQQPINVGALPLGSDTSYVKNANYAERDAALSSDEALNVRIYRQAAPAVANILTKATEYDFWMDPVPVEGAGYGFVIDAKGYMLTNFHVVQGAQTIEVVLGDQSRHAAKFIGADQRNDVALIKIEPGVKPPAVLPLGDSAALQVGQKVLAIGNPFGFQSTLTTGVVSSLGRAVQTGQNPLIEKAIQPEAAINRGNSGGPLINTHGEVIGINSAIYTPSGTTAGIGFAIPINTAKSIAHDLITDGRVHQAFLGVETIPINESFAEALGLPAQEGLLVQTTTRGGPAAAAGIKVGDRVAQAGLRRLYIGGHATAPVHRYEIYRSLGLDMSLTD